MPRENRLNVSASKPLKNIEGEHMLGKQIATEVQAVDLRTPEPLEPLELSVGAVGHILTHGERTLGSGPNDATIRANLDESGERILKDPVDKDGRTLGKSDDRTKLGAELGFRAQSGGVRLDRPVLRAEARTVLVRLLVRVYINRQKDTMKDAA